MNQGTVMPSTSFSNIHEQLSQRFQDWAGRAHIHSLQQRVADSAKLPQILNFNSTDSRQNNVAGQENYFDQLFRGITQSSDSFLRKALVGCFVLSGIAAAEPAMAHDIPNYIMGDGCTCTNPIMMPVPCPVHGTTLDMNQMLANLSLFAWYPVFL